MNDRPLLGLLVAPEPPPGVGALLRALDRWCVPRAADPRHDKPAAWLATSPAAPALDLAAEQGAPLAVWVTSAEESLGVASRFPGAVALTDVGDAVRDVADAVVVGGRIDAARFPYLTPFVRARRRVAAGLPDRLVVSVGTGVGDLADDVAQTALGLASAAIVVGPLLLDALAWGAPCVTDAESAADAGAGDGDEVVVAEPGAFRAAADAIAGDLERAAVLSRAGRRLVERRHDRGRTPFVLARRLGLVGGAPDRRIDEALDELWTPAGARIRDRVDDALAALATSA